MMEFNELPTLFALPPEVIHVNHAAVGPLPLASAQAMKDLVDHLARQGESELTAITQKFEAFRKYGASLLNAPVAEIAFVSNTTEG